MVMTESRTEGSPVRAVRRLTRPDRAARGRGGQRFLLVGLVLASAYSLFPVWWLIVAATKNRVALYQSNGLWFSGWHLWNNVHQVFTYHDGIFLRWTANSFLYAGVGSLGGTLIALATGYGLARFDFPGRNVVFACVVGSFLIPIALLTLPLYLLFSSIGLVDTAWAMLIPCLINPFSVYLAKVYTEQTVPFELLEAARIDGAGELRIFFSIVLRMMTTGGATVFLLAFVNTWNAFFLPKATPEAIVQKLNRATVEAMKTPAVREKLESAGLIFVSDDRTTPDYLAKFVQSEIVKWAAPIKAGGISVD